MKIRVTTINRALAAFLLTVPMVVAAQGTPSYPAKPVRLVVPAAAGLPTPIVNTLQGAVGQAGAGALRSVRAFYIWPDR